jgi:threonine synthase
MAAQRVLQDTCEARKRWNRAICSFVWDGYKRRRHAAGRSLHVATASSAGLPRDRVKAMRAVRETNGAFVAVPDEDIIAAIPTFARLTVSLQNPLCCHLRGAKQAVDLGYIHPEERVVFLANWNALKSTSGASLRQWWHTYRTTLDSVRNALRL